MLSSATQTDRSGRHSTTNVKFGCKTKCSGHTLPDEADSLDRMRRSWQGASQDTVGPCVPVDRLALNEGAGDAALTHGTVHPSPCRRPCLVQLTRRGRSRCVLERPALQTSGCRRLSPSPRNLLQVRQVGSEVTGVGSAHEPQRFLIRTSLYVKLRMVKSSVWLGLLIAPRPFQSVKSP